MYSKRANECYEGEKERKASYLPFLREGSKCPVEQADKGDVTENGATWWLYTDASDSEPSPTAEALNGSSGASGVYDGLHGVDVWLVNLRDFGLRGMFIMLTGCWGSVMDPKLD